MNKIAIIGAGKVGTAMGYLLRDCGYCIVAVASRTIDSAKRAIDFIGEGEASTNLKNTAKKAEIVFITTSDGAIKNVCKKVASEGGFHRGSVVLHMSGALPSDILSSARDVGCHIASVHPLQSLADVREAINNIPGSYFCIEGDEGAVSIAKQIVAALKGKEIMLHVDKKPLYHAGAVVVSNYLVATIGLGLELYEVAGIKKKDSLNALMPLIKGTIKNIEAIGIPSALTGPISRGDVEIVECHLNALSKERQGLVRLYTELGRYAVEVAIEKGTLKKKDAQKIISLFDKYDQGLRYN
jgi:predicted short-subunit dehydrogenase-like oxidoreductase (DUF2520 family)